MSKWGGRFLQLSTVSLVPDPDGARPKLEPDDELKDVTLRQENSRDQI